MSRENVLKSVSVLVILSLAAPALASDGSADQQEWRAAVRGQTRIAAGGGRELSSGRPRNHASLRVHRIPRGRGREQGAGDERHDGERGAGPGRQADGEPVAAEGRLRRDRPVARQLTAALTVGATPRAPRRAR